MNLTISFSAHLCSALFSGENERISRNAMACLKETEWRSKSTSEAKEAYFTRTMHIECPRIASAMLAEESQLPCLPEYDVFLGGSCGTTVWRRQLVIPFLKKKAISYYDPQRSVWSENMIYEESIAKERSSLFLFVIDPATVNATSFLEIAYFAARKSPKLVVVFLGKTEWKQRAHPFDLPDRNRTCLLLDRILDAHDVPMLYSIQDALDYIEEEIIGNKRWTEVLCIPCQRLSYLSLRTKRMVRAAHYTARGAWLRVRSFARRVTLAGAADMVIFIACQMIAPNVPIHFILIPLLLLSLAIIFASERWHRYRLHCPRTVTDSSHILSRTAATIPSPHLATVATPLNLVHARSNLARSKRFCDGIVDDSSSSFIVPDLLRRRVHYRQMVNVSSPTTIELASSAHDETAWLNRVVVPHMDRHNLPYSRLLVMSGIEPECRMKCLMTWAPQLKHFLYLIPTTKTFLSGMVEVAYILGHTNWQITLCVPKEAETLEAPPTMEDDMERASRRRRNDCYQIAFCYLKDMAKRRQCRVFSELDDALLYVAKVSFNGL
uniref:Protein kinase domain-containing protein n=1 Tax=Haemonchus contortus TaxID=6289 RepID=A0A7I5EE95_HAECO